jgi:hypothetical protein
MSRIGVGATSGKKIKKNQPSAKYAEAVVCCLIASTMRTRAILLVLIHTEMVSITITTINQCRYSIGRERARSIESEAWHQEQLDTKREGR